MKNKKGQALVEFVIILNIFVFMLLAIIDIGKIIFMRNELEQQLSEVIDLYRNDSSYNEIVDELRLEEDQVSLEIKNEDNEQVTFYLKKEVEIITPGLNLILDNPYSLEVQRVIAYAK